MRGHVALSVTFGYELDIKKIAEEERNMIPEQTQMYHKYHDLIRTKLTVWKVQTKCTTVKC